MKQEEQLEFGLLPGLFVKYWWKMELFFLNQNLIDLVLKKSYFKFDEIMQIKRWKEDQDH